MTILEKIMRQKVEDVRRAKALLPENALRELPNFSRACLSLSASLRNPERNGMIAEYKRASPSKGLINGHSPIAEVVQGYQEAGAAAISVLTDRSFFWGGIEDLEAARQLVSIPVLRKDFTVDPYQITEAKAYGADIVLLIAAALPPAQIRSLSEYAKTLGLNVLLEIHNRAELEANTWDSIDAVGVNNRNLHDFSVSVSTSMELSDAIPSQYLKISESGLRQPETISQLKAAGFEGFLIGEHFMRTEDPVGEMKRFCAQLGE